MTNVTGQDMFICDQMRIILNNDVESYLRTILFIFKTTKNLLAYSQDKRIFCLDLNCKTLDVSDSYFTSKAYKIM